MCVCLSVCVCVCGLLCDCSRTRGCGCQAHSLRRRGGIQVLLLSHLCHTVVTLWIHSFNIVVTLDTTFLPSIGYSCSSTILCGHTFFTTSLLDSFFDPLLYHFPKFTTTHRFLRHKFPFHLTSITISPFP
jgi:hypothetical protein